MASDWEMLTLMSNWLNPHNASEKIQNVNSTMNPISPRKRIVFITTRHLKSISAADSTRPTTAASRPPSAGQIYEKHV